MIPIFPVSPVPAGLKRSKRWGENVTKYDSGVYQGMTPWSRPLFSYEVPFQNIPITKQNTLAMFVDTVRGRALPFFFKDPYDFAVNSAMAVRSGITAGTLTLFDERSFFIRADTTTIGSLFSSLSGFVTLGVDYNYDQDTGIISIIAKAATDVWGTRSGQFFRKCHFTSDYSDQGIIWQQFSMALRFEEVA